MSIYTAITSHYILNQAVVMANIPLYLGQLPQGVNPPAVTYMLISGIPIVTHDGESSTRNERFQFTAIAAYLDDAAVIRENFRKLLTTIPGNYTDVVIQSCVPASGPRDIKDDVNNRWNAIQDFRLIYNVIGA